MFIVIFLFLIHIYLGGLSAADWSVRGGGSVHHFIYSIVRGYSEQ